jgi:hypothetical protein
VIQGGYVRLENSLKKILKVMVEFIGYQFIKRIDHPGGILDI